MERKEVNIEDKYIKWFSELRKKDVNIAGGKAANLGEMLKIGMPVPQGFVITASSYEYFLEATGLKDKIYSMLDKINVDNTSQLEETAEKIREIIEKAEMPEDLRKEIVESYDLLSLDKNSLGNISDTALSILKLSDPSFVAVRSSATAEDSSKASFAGQQETFLNVKGKEALIQSVKKCFASLFTARSVYYRIKKGFKHEEVLIAVVIQLMVNSDKSGVIFSKDPITKKDNVVIEAVFGLGEGIVSGRIQPDNYIVSRELEIIEKRIAEKKIAIVRNSAGKNETIKLIGERSKQQVLKDYEIKKLADYALKLEKHYNLPQDIEFAISSNEIYIVQTRPITTLGKEVKKQEVSGKIILEGFAASPGIGSGEVKVVLDLKDLDKIKRNDVLVTKMTNPDMVVSMQKCSAIVTDEGGLTAHAAIVSREMGIPCVVGTDKATEILKDGMLVTVDGFTGRIYEGKLEKLREKKVEILPVVKTETNIKVMVDLPSFAERASKTEIKEVGLLRLEGIIAESRKHPYNFLKSGNIKEYQEIIYCGISEIAKYFDKLWIRTSDIRSDEFRNLEGSGELEENPMLGMHGIRAGLKYREILTAELNAINQLAGEKEVGILLPQIISLDEVKEVKNILAELGIKNIKLGVMIETPAAVQIAEDLCREGISFISFGTNDLTQFTLAVDRGNSEVQGLYDEMNPAVLKQLEYVIKVCKKYNVETSICGQAGSSEKMAEFLVKLGIDSISVNADKAEGISKFVKNLEDRGLRGISLEKKEEKDLKEEAIDSDMARKKKEAEVKEDKEEKSAEEKKEEDIAEKVGETVKEAVKEVAEEIKEKAEEVKEAVEEEWKDLEFGIDIFASHGKDNEEKEESKDEEEEKGKKEEKREEESEEEGEQILDIF